MIWQSPNKQPLVSPFVRQLVLLGSVLALTSGWPQIAVTQESECIILDDEDEDEDGVCGIPIRFPGDAKARKKAAEEGREPNSPELYRIVLDEEDETNESGFGIPLPTEDNPNPWNRHHPNSVVDDEDIWDDD